VHHILIALENEAVPQGAIANSTSHSPLINTLWESEVDLACSIEGLQIFGGEFKIQAGTRALLGPCCDPACWETDFTAETTPAALCSSGKNSFIPSMVIHAPSALPFAVIFSARRSVDPFLYQILSRNGMQSLERSPNPTGRRPVSHLRSTVPALTRSATPAFKHTINVVANCVSGIHAVKSLHKKAIVFRMPMSDVCHHGRS